jgi:hypothetical protein
MKRQALDDGRWFDLDSAKKYEEETRWNGNNHVSHATGDTFEHETLYRTAGGRWIVHHWSQWQGSRDTWTEIDDADAARWLVINKYEPHPACKEEFAALEVK